MCGGARSSGLPSLVEPCTRLIEGREAHAPLIMLVAELDQLQLSWGSERDYSRLSRAIRCLAHKHKPAEAASIFDAFARASQRKPGLFLPMLDPQGT
jgi:hypothetical protein